MSAHDYVNCLEKTVAQGPGLPDLWNHYGLVLAHLGHGVEALHAMERALEVNPNYLAAGISRAFLLGDAGRTDEALRQFHRFRGASDDFDLVFSFGVFCMRAGWSEIGVRQLRRAEAMRPNAPIVLAHLADALDERGHSASAQKRRRRLAEILRSLGIAALLTRFEIDGGPPAASRSWEDPFLARVPVLVARYLRSRGELEAAREELLRGNQRYPGHCELMIEMGRDLMGRQEVNQAMDWFSSAVLVDPTCHEGYLESGFLHACKGHTHLAAHALRTAVTLRPLFADYRFHLGTLLLDTGETEQAIRELRTALTLQPGHSECALHLAGALARAGRAAEAVETLKSSSCRGWPEALFLLAECCLEIDLEEEARSALERLLSADPGDAKARALLETLKQAS